MRPARLWKQTKRYLRDARHELLGLLQAVLDPWEEVRLKARLRRGEPLTLPCLEPFKTLNFMDRGIVTCCCQAYTRVHAVGNMRRQSIEQLWNGPVLRRIRRRLLLGQWQKVCRPHCPFLQGPPVEVEALPETNEAQRQLKADLRQGHSRLSVLPDYFTLSNWGPCNLRCKMCDSWSDTRMPAYVRKTYENIYRLAGREITIKMTGSGDPLARRDTRELMEALARERNRTIRIELLTNGLLLTPERWARIKDCRFTSINVSIDAACAETYELIRRGGNWERLMEALELIRCARDEGHFEYAVINMTVMRSNYREIPAFIELARRHGFVAYFTPIRGAYGDENIFEPGDRAALAELRQILVDCAGLYDEAKLFEVEAYFKLHPEPVALS